MQLTPFSLDTDGTKLREDAILISRNHKGFKVSVCITNSDELQIGSELRRYENRHRLGFNQEVFKSATVIEYEVNETRTKLLDVFNAQVKLNSKHDSQEIFTVASLLKRQPKNLQTAYATLHQTANLLCADYMNHHSKAMLYRNCAEYEKAYLSLDALPNIAFDNQIYGRFTSPLRRLEDLVNLKCFMSAFNHEPPPYSQEDMLALVEKKRISIGENAKLTAKAF